MTLLEGRNLTVRYGNRTVLDRADFTLDAGEWLMLVGPNGAGKSTLLGAVSQGIAYEGAVLFQGEDVRRCKPDALAKRIGVLSQTHAVGYSFAVGEVVRLGRYAYAPGVFSGRSDEDEARVAEALRMTGMTDLEDQSVLTLSGGELQRTFLAQLFAQNPSVLLLDEPTNHLDLGYQKQVFELLEAWLQTPGRAVLSVVHDLSLARTYGTKELLLNGGRTAAFGAAKDVFTPELLAAVYGMDVYAWMRDMYGQWRETDG